MIAEEGLGDRHGRDAHRDLSADRARALALTPVSRETADRLDRFVELLLSWQQRMNLIASSTEAQLWTRHVANSLQLLALAPQARVWVDLGSGGGFPGLVIACALAETAGAQVHLVESSTKKAAFLREAGRVTGAPVSVHASRIDAVRGERAANSRRRHRAGLGADGEAPGAGVSPVEKGRIRPLSQRARCGP